MVTRVLIRDIAGKLRMLRLNARDARYNLDAQNGARPVVSVLRREQGRLLAVAGRAGRTCRCAWSLDSSGEPDIAATQEHRHNQLNAQKRHHQKLG